MNGQIDPTFGVNGSSRLHFNRSTTQTLLAIAPDDSIFAADGTAYLDMAQHDLVRFTNDQSSADPTPPAVAFNQPSLLPRGEGSKVFSVTFTDQIPIAASQFNSANLIVTGPRGYRGLPTYLGYADLPNGKGKIAYYRLNRLRAHGSYTIALNDQTTMIDTDGNALGSGSLGGFVIGRAGRTSPFGPSFSTATAKPTAVFNHRNPILMP